MLKLKISAPFATFTPPESREYFSTYSEPPESTVYGCLLSFIGETDPEKHRSSKLKINLTSAPQKAKVIRKIFRFKVKNQLNHPTNKSLDYQEILCGVEFEVIIDSKEDPNNLEERLRNAIAHPETIDRFGALSLGHSCDLIDDVYIVE
ncbi:CRISPR-associated protein Cas5 [Capilliphycus salinus ALCB114379]|uniref:CRISPR-associated protein Cas5 n=1 Tax=Capilliphycus salinus TaxID=2768948 RepID=UPI0039A573BC